MSERLAGHAALNAFAYSDLVRQPQPVPPWEWRYACIQCEQDNVLEPRSCSLEKTLFLSRAQLSIPPISLLLQGGTCDRIITAPFPDGEVKRLLHAGEFTVDGGLSQYTA